MAATHLPAFSFYEPLPRTYTSIIIKWTNSPAFTRVHSPPTQLRGEDFDGADLLPWAQPHAAAVAGLDVQPDARAALTASADGSLAVTQLDSDGGDCRRVWACGGAVTHTAAKWAGAAGAAVTASLQGRVQAWDTRSGGGGDTARGPLVAELAATSGVPLMCLDVHPAQSYCVAAGDAEGRVHVWDMRRLPSGGGPSCGAGGSGGGSEVAVVAVGGGAALSALAFDAGVAATAATSAARLVYGTSGGEVGLIRDAAGGTAPQRLYAEPAAGVAALALGAVGPSSQLFAFTEQEGLVFIANAV